MPHRGGHDIVYERQTSEANPRHCNLEAGSIWGIRPPTHRESSMGMASHFHIFTPCPNLHVVLPLYPWNHNKDKNHAGCNHIEGHGYYSHNISDAMGRTHSKDVHENEGIAPSYPPSYCGWKSANSSRMEHIAWCPRFGWLQRTYCLWRVFWCIKMQRSQIQPRSGKHKFRRNYRFFPIRATSGGRNTSHGLKQCIPRLCNNGWPRTRNRWWGCGARISTSLTTTRHKKESKNHYSS